MYGTRPEFFFLQAAVPAGEGTYYYAGGFYGGRVGKVRDLLQSLVAMTTQDIDRDMVAIFHDESQINRYWASHPPAVTLSSAFLYPEPTPERCWGRPDLEPQEV